MKLVAIFGSPHLEGFSSTLHKEFLKPLIKKNISIDYFYPYKMNIKPCIDCTHCKEQASCIFNDDMNEFYKSIIDADIVSISSPLYFSSVTAPLKMLIDRCQMIWRNSVKLNIPNINLKDGYFFSTAGSEYQNMFETQYKVLNHFTKTIGFTLDKSRSFFVNNCDLIDNHNSKNLDYVRLLGSSFIKKI